MRLFGTLISFRDIFGLFGTMGHLIRPGNFTTQGRIQRKKEIITASVNSNNDSAKTQTVCSAIESGHDYN